MLHGGLAPDGPDRDRSTSLCITCQKAVQPGRIALPVYPSPARGPALFCDGPPLDYRTGDYGLLIWTPIPERITSAHGVVLLGYLQSTGYVMSVLYVRSALP